MVLKMRGELIVLVAALALWNAGCQACGMAFKSMEADTAGLRWTVTLYSTDGHVIREWNTRSTLNSAGGEADFRDNAGRYVHVSGTFVVEETH